MNVSLKTIYKNLRLQVSRNRTDGWRLYGKLDENHAITIIYAGREKNKEYIKELVFGNSCLEEESFGRIWKYQLKRIANQRASIFVSEYDPDQEKTDGNGSGFMIPFWLGWVADVSGDLKKIIKSSRTLEYNVSKIRRNNLACELTNDPLEYEKFYDAMYLPYMGKRFETTAALMGRSEMQSQLDRCQLMYVKKDQDYLSGVIIKYESDLPRIWSIGVKDGNLDYVNEGAIGALYYFLIAYLKEKGYQRINFGATRSFLGDGVLNYKKKWPLQNAGFTKQGFRLQLVTKSAATIELLASKPFIFVEKNKLNSAVFLSPNGTLGRKEIKKIHKSSFLNGLEKFVLYASGKQIQSIENEIPPELKDSCVLRDADRLFLSPLQL